MTILVVGASGATGRLFVEQLLVQKHTIKIVVRSIESLQETWKNNNQIQIIVASILEMSDQEMSDHVFGCHAIASCLRHTASWKGIYGHPRKLVTDATRRLCHAVEVNKPSSPIKYVLMNTVGNHNRDANEPISFAQKCVIGLIRLLLPPHVDNENAADYLRTQIGQNHEFVEWTVIRPDGLINKEEVSDYEIHGSPIRSAIFNAGKTSRINVSNFMAQLISDGDLWNTWKG